MRIVIEGEFTQLNDYIRAERGNRYGGAGIKKAETARAYWAGKAFPYMYPLGSYYRIEFTWYCPDMRTDPDNIAFAKKFILDGLKEARVIPTDGWKFVRELFDRFEVDAARPRVEVKIVSLSESSKG